jgi:putative flippase GtrA
MLFAVVGGLTVLVYGGVWWMCWSSARRDRAETSRD